MREMLQTYRDKNADYGDSFSKSYKEFGLTAPVVRMSDKMERIKSLTKADAKVKDESIKDTLIDLANYAIMTVVEMEQEQPDVLKFEHVNNQHFIAYPKEDSVMPLVLSKDGRPISLKEVHPGLKTATYRGYQIYIKYNNDFFLPVYPNGYYCGYVKIPTLHPFYGEKYQDLEDIDVHGGLTFSGYLDDIGEDKYLLGFDCGHAGDNVKIHDENYTLQECKKLVDQLIEVEE